MIVDTSGVYFHNEGPHVLAGYSPPEDAARIFLQVRRRRVLPEGDLAPAVRPDELVSSACATSPGGPGLYAVTPDRSAIMGRLAARLFEAHSFSGRGVMQSYGAGQALADLIAKGGYEKS